MGYVTFLLDLAAEGEIRWIKDSLRFRPDPERVPVNAFAWKVTCDSNGVVIIRALHDKRLRVIAAATYTNKLDKREQLANEPTMYQWNTVEEALRLAQAERAEKGGDEDVISEPLGLMDRRSLKESPPDLREAVREERRRERQGARKKNESIGIFVGIGIVIALSVGVYFAVGREAKKEPATSTYRSEPTTTTTTAPTPVTPPSAAPVVEPPRPSLDEAFAAAKSDLDTLASYQLRWSDVDVASQTTLAKVEKDPDAERGRRVCADGTLERITKSERAGRTFYAGALVTKEGDRVEFLVGGTTGELVKRDSAKLCGIVTGTVDGATHVFGMFDLPENRNPVVEKP